MDCSTNLAKLVAEFTTCSSAFLFFLLFFFSEKKKRIIINQVARVLELSLTMWLTHRQFCRHLFERDGGTCEVKHVCPRYVHRHLKPEVPKESGNYQQMRHLHSAKLTASTATFAPFARRLPSTTRLCTSSTRRT